MTLRLRWAQGVLILFTAFTGWYIGERQTLFALVCGNSMEPALRSGQLRRLHHGLPEQLPRGLVVIVSRFPDAPAIKRVVGLPGETISFQVGEVFVNGRMLRENYLPACQTTFSWKYTQFNLQEDEYVVLGDNRLTSQDSRDYGVVKRSRIIASIEVPSPQARLLDQPFYRLTRDGREPHTSCMNKSARKVVSKVTPPPFTSRSHSAPPRQEDALTKG